MSSWGKKQHSRGQETYMSELAPNRRVHTQTENFSSNLFGFGFLGLEPGFGCSCLALVLAFGFDIIPK